MRTFNLRFTPRNMEVDAKALILDRISPSMIGQFLACPLDFYYSSILKLKVPDEENIHLIFGGAVHKAIEEMYKGSQDPKGVFIQEFDVDKLDKKSQQQHAQFMLMGQSMMDNYLQLHPTLDKIYKLADGTSELRFRKPIMNPQTGEMSRIPLSGVVDRHLTMGHRIVEYKTSKGPWSPKETRFKVQSRLYSMWAWTEFGKLPDEVLYFVLFKKIKSSGFDKTIQVIRYKPTLDDLAEMWEEMDTILDKVEAGVFERPSHGHPPYCNCFKFERMLNART